MTRKVKRMNQISEYVREFFMQLHIGADDHEKHHYKDFIEAAINRFLENEYKDKAKEYAYDVYRVFLDCYGYTAVGEQHSFVEFLDQMRRYEQNAAALTRKQRDHFIHSVNVFLLGLAVYQSSGEYREVFYLHNFRQELYAGRCDTAQEEFFFRWGLASLCHDIGYPIEIITNMVNDFINFSTRVQKEDRPIFAHVEYDRFDAVNTIPEKKKKRDFIRKYYDKYDSCVYIDLLKPVDLLAQKLHMTLGVDLQAVKERLDGYVADSGRTGRVDHGFFSAVILLKWYGFLIQASPCDPDELFYPVLDSASAILLHNFYNVALVENTKRPNPFHLGPLEPEKHSIAYLLMLCDELQDWNRETYGDEDRQQVSIDSAVITLTEGRLDVTYLISKGAMPEEFIGKKTGLLNTLLNVKSVFPSGMTIGCEAVIDEPIPPEKTVLTAMQLEQLAIAIHNRYNAFTLRKNPEAKIKYPRFSDLPKEKKYYNYHTAMEYTAMLRTVGCEIRPLGDYDEERVTGFTPEEVERLAVCEHDHWMRCRAEQGWVYGETKSKALKTNPCMVPYERLPEEIQEYDLEPARDIPKLLEAIGLGVYRRAPTPVEAFTPEQIEIMARSIHNYYNERTAIIRPDEKLIPFEELSEEKKESNRRQARGIPNKLRHIGCVLRPIGAPGSPVTSFPLRTVEMLAEIEHAEWMGEKILHGWTYDPVRDEQKKHNAYLIDYNSLEEPIKEYDRDTVRHMPEVIKACGYAIYEE